MESKRTFRIKLAGRVIEISCLFDNTYNLCKDYLIEDDVAPDITVTTTQADIEKERDRADDEYTDGYFETLAVYRKICTQMAHYDTMLMHGSALAVHAHSFIFIALSGTGKTTHTRLWLKNIPDSYVINGDKPLISLYPIPIIHGTPWCGKEGYNKNTSVPLEAIVILNRGEKNSIKEITPGQAMAIVYQQTYKPESPQEAAMVIKLCEKLLNQVKCYELFCNMEDDAAITAAKVLLGNDLITDANLPTPKSTTNFKEELSRSGHIAYTNKGVSMLPLLRQDKDIMIIKKGKPPYQKGDAVLFIRDNGAYVLHRITKVLDNNKYYIIGDNCISGETVRQDQIIGVLESVKRGSKTLSTESTGYKLYVKLVPVLRAINKCKLPIRHIGGKILRKLGLRK